MKRSIFQRAVTIFRACYGFKKIHSLLLSGLGFLLVSAVFADAPSTSTADPALLGVKTNESFRLHGEGGDVDVTVQAEHYPDESPVRIELFSDAAPASANSVVAKTVRIQNDRAQATLPIPAALPPGLYRWHVFGETEKIRHENRSQTYRVLERGDKTYYVSSSEGDDANDGLSAETPIRSLRRASQIELKPGERLLLKSGDLWTGQSLFPKGNGTKKAPISISSYGEGPRPRIAPGIGKHYYGIRLVDVGGYRINNLEISDCYGGIVAWTEDTYNHRYLRIENCFLHDITGKDTGFCVAFHPDLPPDLLYGIGVMVAGSDAVGDSTLFSDITIVNCEFDRCDVGIQILPRDHLGGDWSKRSHDLITCNAYRNVQILDCKVLRSYRSGGVMLYCVRDGKAENVLVDQTGYKGVGMFWGVAAFQVARVSDYLVQKCTFSNTIKGNSPDGQGFDFESDCRRVTLKDCRIVDNEGPAVLFFGGTWKGSNTDNVIDGCFIKGNNRSRDFYNNTFAMMHPDNTGIVRNTTIHLLTDDQGFDCRPLVFDGSNRVFSPSGKTVFPGNDRKPDHEAIRPTSGKEP